MNLFKPSTLSAEQIERRRKIQSKGRKHYIVHTGILRFGVFMFVFNTLWQWHDAYRWQLPPRGDLFIDSVDVAFELAVWLAAGYFFGATMWKQQGFEDSPELHSETPAKPSSPV